MDWFDPADQPGDIKDLPKEFAEAKALWKKDADGNHDKIIKLLTPFVGARFMPSNISNWEELFVDAEGEGMIELTSTSVKVAGIDFTRFPIPICKAEAYFEVEVTKEFASIDLDEWQNNNGRFTDGIAFYWDVPKEGDLEDLDFSFGDNQGIECIALDAQESSAIKEIILVDPGLAKVAVVKTLCIYLELDLKSAKNLIEAVPVSIANSKSDKWDESLAGVLEKLGATVKIK